MRNIPGRLHPVAPLVILRSGFLKPGATFTRAGTGYARGPTGSLTSYGTNVQRISSNVFTGSPGNYAWSPRRLVLEDLATNLFPGAQFVTNTNVTQTTGIASPDNGTNAFGVVATAAAGLHYMEQDLGTVTANTNHAESIYVKQGGTPKIELRILGTAGAFAGVVLDFSTGIATSNVSGGFAGTLTMFGASAVGDGWYRLYISAIPDTTTTTRRAQLYLFDATGATASFTGDGTTVMLNYIWPQTELGQLPGTFIPPATARATEAMNLIGIMPTTMASGSLVLQFDLPYGGGSFAGARAICAIGINNVLTTSVLVDVSTFLRVFFNTSGQTISTGATAFGFSAMQKFGISWQDGGNIRMAYNGLSLLDISNPNTGVNRINLGARQNGTTGKSRIEYQAIDLYTSPLSMTALMTQTA